MKTFGFKSRNAGMFDKDHSYEKIKHRGLNTTAKERSLMAEKSQRKYYKPVTLAKINLGDDNE